MKDELVERVARAIEDQLTAEDGWMVGTPQLKGMCRDFAQAAITALQPEAAPVAWMYRQWRTGEQFMQPNRANMDQRLWTETPLYAHPPVDKIARLQRERDQAVETLRNPPKHHYWGAGEPDCPSEIKAGNGELHTLRCKVCGEDSPRNPICLAAFPSIERTEDG